MKTQYLSLLCICLLAVGACKSSAPEAKSESMDVSGASGSVELGVPEGSSPQERQALEEGLMGDPNMFPFVYQEAGRVNRFEAYSMRFQLTHHEQIYPMTNLQTPWLKPENYSEKAGNFVTYVRNGRDLSLTNPYISVQYIKRDMPYTSTVDSIYLWLDDTHVNRKEGSVLSERTTLTTASKIVANCKEYTTPGATDVKVPGKYIAYAYLPYDEEYILGFALTCSEMTDFEVNQPLFYELVASFQYR